MERLVKGDVVVLPFPFSDLQSTKRRPALVLAVLEHDDVLLAQITSSAYASEFAIPLTESDFNDGQLRATSFVRPDKLFTASSGIVLYRAAGLTPTATERVITGVVAVLRR